MGHSLPHPCSQIFLVYEECAFHNSCAPPVLHVLVDMSQHAVSFHLQRTAFSSWMSFTTNQRIGRAAAAAEATAAAFHTTRLKVSAWQAWMDHMDYLRELREQQLLLVSAFIRWHKHTQQQLGRLTNSRSRGFEATSTLCSRHADKHFQPNVSSCSIVSFTGAVQRLGGSRNVLCRAALRKRVRGMTGCSSERQLHQRRLLQRCFRRWRLLRQLPELHHCRLLMVRAVRGWQQQVAATQQLLQGFHRQRLRPRWLRKFWALWWGLCQLMKERRVALASVDVWRARYVARASLRRWRKKVEASAWRRAQWVKAVGHRDRVLVIRALCCWRGCICRTSAAILYRQRRLLVCAWWVWKKTAGMEQKVNGGIRRAGKAAVGGAEVGGTVGGCGRRDDAAREGQQKGVASLIGWSTQHRAVGGHQQQQRQQLLASGLRSLLPQSAVGGHHGQQHQQLRGSGPVEGHQQQQLQGFGLSSPLRHALGSVWDAVGGDRMMDQVRPSLTDITNGIWRQQQLRQWQYEGCCQQGQLLQGWQLTQEEQQQQQQGQQDESSAKAGVGYDGKGIWTGKAALRSTRDVSVQYCDKGRDVGFGCGAHPCKAASPLLGVQGCKCCSAVASLQQQGMEVNAPMMTRGEVAGCGPGSGCGACKSRRSSCVGRGGKGGGRGRGRGAGRGGVHGRGGRSPAVVGGVQQMHKPLAASSAKVAGEVCRTSRPQGDKRSR